MSHFVNLFSAVQTSCLSSNINEKLADSVLTHPCAGQAILVKSHGVIDGTEEGIQDHIACNGKVQ